jgi:2-polyprenyl-6-methoxyphenol hydroxylase-like FAD-dependent oxidoreductase
VKVLIAGAGIAGPAAAVALARAGISTEVFEDYPQDAEDAGAFLTLTANGQDALRAIGADQPMLDASFPATRLRLFSPAGVLLADAPLGRDHPCPRSITRAALSGLLRAMAEELGAVVHYGKRLVIAAIDPDDRVTATFGDGTRATGDLLIGADGVHSPIRTLIDPAAPTPRDVGLTVACGYADIAPPAPAGSAEGYAMFYGSRAFFGCTAGPDGRTWWFARIPGLPAVVPSSPDPDRIAAAFDTDETPAARLIRATAGPLTVTRARDLAQVPTWSNGAMVVIGDAAHAASPVTTQGASLAIEDAVVLAQCLRDVPDRAVALATYEHFRRARVEAVVLAGGSGENPVPSPPGSRGSGQAGSVYAHHIDWDATIVAPKT